MFRTLRRAVFTIATLLAGLAPATAQDKSPPRLALVIGNAAYPAALLPTADNDAGLVAATLARAGFDVTAAADPDSETLRKIVAGFLAKAQAAATPDMIVVTYLSGYGLQVDGDNVLVPVDATIPRDVDVTEHAFRLSDISRPLDAMPAKARLFVYDLARTSPFATAGAPLASGLAPVQAAPGSIVAFNTAPGTVAPEDVAPYGIYARALSQELVAHGFEARELFERLRLRVAQISDGAEIPWDTLSGDQTLVGATPATPSEPTTPTDRPIAGLSPDVAFFLTLSRDTLAGYDDYEAAFAGEPLAARARTLEAVRREALIWAASVKADVAPAYWTYLRFYPRGPHVFDARRRLALIHQALEPPPRFEAWPFGALGAPSPDEVVLLAPHPLTLTNADWISLPPPPDGLLPPPPPDEFDTPLPPLAVPGSLPLPMPRDWTPTTGAGLIREPVVAGYPDLDSRYARGPDGAGLLETTSSGHLLSRTEVRTEGPRRVATQRDGRGAVISRTVTTHGADNVTTVQTGPTGGILTKVSTRTDAAGAHAMTMTDGSNQMVATLDRDKNGVVTAIKRGLVAASRQMFMFDPGVGPNNPPRVRTLAEAMGGSSKTGSPSAASPHPPAPVSPPPASSTDPAPPPELQVEAAPALPTKPAQPVDPAKATLPAANSPKPSATEAAPGSTPPGAAPEAVELPAVAPVPMPPPRPTRAKPVPGAKGRAVPRHPAAARKTAPHRAPRRHR